MIRSIYIDTSVFGGYFDDEFRPDTIPFFDKIVAEKTTIIISETVVEEIENAPVEVRDFFNSFQNNIIKVLITDEVKSLANKYIEANILTEKYRSDCYHIAAATIFNVDALVSWNFKHIVNFERKRGYNAINLFNGYKQIEIISPKEVKNYVVG